MQQVWIEKIVIENLRVGTLDGLGIGYDALAPQHPRLIYCSITGFGRTGPDPGFAS